MRRDAASGGGCQETLELRPGFYPATSSSGQTADDGGTWYGKRVEREPIMGPEGGRQSPMGYGAALFVRFFARTPTCDGRTDIQTQVIAHTATA